MQEINLKNYHHYPVMLKEVLELLNIKPDGIYVDCTLGGAGHSSEILKRIPKGHLYAFEQDEMVIASSKAKLAAFGNNFTIINNNFANLKEELASQGIEKVDGIFYDLGVSSFQLDIPERGFSYQADAPLDMRMDQRNELSAYEVVNNYSEADLKRILFEYGEERYAPLIVKKIISNRPVNTTFELVDLIKQALPASVLRKEKHPAKKSFQAIRIEVNQELAVFRQSLTDAFTLLNKDGRIVVLTFHSLEDRLCKQLFKEQTSLDLPPDLPFIPEGYDIEFALVNQKVITASEEELSLNNRSHSAKLRAIQKIKD